jgi:serine phosphatase RsbU (regulator of sigma subunit)
VSPFNSLRRETRAVGVRVLAGMAVFSTLALMLIAATAVGPLAKADATQTGAPAQGGDPALAPEPVLGAEVPAEPAPAPEPAVAPAPEPAATPEPAAAPEPEPAPEPAAAPAAAPESAPAPESEPAPAAAPEPAAAASEPSIPPAERQPPETERAEESGDGPPAERDARAQEPAEDSRSGDESEEDSEAPGRRVRGEEPIGEEPQRGELERAEAEEDEESGAESEFGEQPVRADRGQGPGNGWARGQGPATRRSPNLIGAFGGARGAGGAEESATLDGAGRNFLALSIAPTQAAPPVSVVQPTDGASPAAPVPPLPAAPSPEAPESPEGDAVQGQPAPPQAAPAPPASAPPGTSDPGGTAGTTTDADTGTGTASGTDVAEGFVPAPAADADAFSDPIGRSQGDGDGSANRGDERVTDDDPGQGGASIVRRPFEVVNHVPDALKYALAALGALSVMLAVGYFLAAMRARSLGRQRRELLQEVGLLQSALLPPVPDKLGSLRTSVAYRPADGPGAGGDFYDVLPLAAGSVGFILGDVSGHGRGALARTAFMRYTLRAYLEAGLEPRAALQVAGRVIDENLGGDFATVLLAVHDPETGSLTYATAGHPAPIVVGPETHDPVTAGSSPPIGVGVPTGLRQTTVPLVPGAVACLFTDGLMDARVAGGVLGRGRLEDLLRELGDHATARELIQQVSNESRVLSDDIAAVVVSPADGAPTVPRPRTEQLELSARELEGPIAQRFLESCGVSRADTDAAVEGARVLAGTSGAAVLDVVFGDTPRVEVLPRDVDSIEAASRRASTP